MTTPPRPVAAPPADGRPGAAAPALPSVTATTGSSLAVQVMTAVRRAITAGEMEPGRLYSVQQLASAMDVSRSPVREGLLRLGEAGLIRFHRNRGFEIVQVSPTDVAEILAVRTALEVPAARRAARLAGPEELARVRTQWEALHEAARTGDLEATAEADEGLHRLLLLAAGNAQAVQLVERLRTTTSFLGVVAATSRRPVEELAREHDALVRAVLARDQEAAARAMREHLASTAQRLVAHALRAQDTPEDRVHELTAREWSAAVSGY
ncbi:GntR family transcriptional regulator [Kocuria sp. NPDC057446]|uniref:GntR family transcriptional regulator n=1 Tax=Kocuria sp. NPDC057446 TaxID=3346137 RepID=UPI0036848031